MLEFGMDEEKIRNGDGTITCKKEEALGRVKR